MCKNHNIYYTYFFIFFIPLILAIAGALYVFTCANHEDMIDEEDYIERCYIDYEKERDHLTCRLSNLYSMGVVIP